MSENYKRTFLDNVILRIDFDPIVDSEKFLAYQEKLAGIFPFKEQSQGYKGTIEINVLKDQVVSQKEKTTTYDYLDAYRNKRVRITPDFLTIEYMNRSYSNSEELLEDCKKIVDEFLKEFSITTINRLGLRYINRFDLDAEVTGSIEWKKFFSVELLGAIDFAQKLVYPLSRAMTSLQLRVDDHNILVRYGIWNQDFPSENNRKEFIIDIDASSRAALEPIAEISTLLKKYNSNIEKIFELSIKEDLRNILNKENV